MTARQGFCAVTLSQSTATRHITIVSHHTRSHHKTGSPFHCTCPYSPSCMGTAVWTAAEESRPENRVWDSEPARSKCGEMQANLGQILSPSWGEKKKGPLNRSCRVFMGRSWSECKVSNGVREAVSCGSARTVKRAEENRPGQQIGPKGSRDQAERQGRRGVQTRLKDKAELEETRPGRRIRSTWSADRATPPGPRSRRTGKAAGANNCPSRLSRRRAPTRC